MITYPANGSVVRRGSTIRISATATDDTRVTATRFYVNSHYLCTSNSTPYGCYWTPRTNASGQYRLLAVAWDAQGNTGSSSITVFAPASQ